LVDELAFTCHTRITVGFSEGNKRWKIGHNIYAWRSFKLDL